MKNQIKSFRDLNPQSGQLLLEILVVVSIAAVIIGLGSQFIYVSLRANKAAAEKNVGLGLLEETLEAAQAASTEKWQNLYNLTHGSTNYYPAISSGKWAITAGTETPTLNGITYTRYFTVQHVCRDDFTRHITVISDTSGADLTCNGAPSGDSLDPSTEKISVTVSWPNADALTATEYVTRWRNKVCNQSSWVTSGSTGVTTCTGSTVYDSKTVDIDLGVNTEIKLVAGPPVSGDLTSSVFDMINTNGGSLNAVSWAGTVPVGTKVRFQLAASNCSNGKTNPPDCNDAGDWSFIGGATCGTTDYYESATSEKVVETNCTAHKNKQYYRYKIQLCSGNTCAAPAGADTPIVTDINVSWSP